MRTASGKPFLSLQFDEHQNDAGAMTRCEAYLDSKGFLRWWSQPEDELSAAEADAAYVGGSESRRSDELSERLV